MRKCERIVGCNLVDGWVRSKYRQESLIEYLEKRRICRGWVEDFGERRFTERAICTQDRK